MNCHFKLSIDSRGITLHGEAVVIANNREEAEDRLHLILASRWAATENSPLKIEFVEE